MYVRHYAEYAGYWMETKFPQEAVGDPQEAVGDPQEAVGDPQEAVGEGSGFVTFYDTVYGFPLFKAPVGRSWKAFVEESQSHGWPSFRDQEVIWDHVRVLQNGEVVSDQGTHLGQPSNKNMQKHAYSI